MSKDFQEQKLKAFLADLGSAKGAPGGGAAAALTAAIGTALVEMVAHLNDARLKKNSGSAKKAAQLRVKLQHLMKVDAEVFEHLQKIYKDRAKKPAAWQAALKNGAIPPLEICDLSRKAIRLSEAEAHRTSAWLVSDLREAKILLRAAFLGARLNVLVNLKDITDRGFTRSAKKRLR